MGLNAQGFQNMLTKSFGVNNSLHDFKKIRSFSAGPLSMATDTETMFEYFEESVQAILKGVAPNEDIEFLQLMKDLTCKVICKICFGETI